MPFQPITIKIFTFVTIAFTVGLVLGVHYHEPLLPNFLNNKKDTIDYHYCVLDFLGERSQSTVAADHIIDSCRAIYPPALKTPEPNYKFIDDLPEGFVLDEPEN